MNTNLFSLSSLEVDNYLGIRMCRIEQELLNSARSLRPKGNLFNLGEVLHGGNQTWVGLDPQTLNTPYVELIEMCHLLSLKEGELIVDLGAGYGRLGVVLDSYYPQTSFIGYELVSERVREGNKTFKALGCMNATLLEQDLMADDFVIPEAHVYFLYDFGKTSHIRSVLNKLENLADKNHHFKLVARGKGSRSIIAHEYHWLTNIDEDQTGRSFSIYSF